MVKYWHIGRVTVMWYWANELKDEGEEYGTRYGLDIMAPLYDITLVYTRYIK